MDKRIREEYLKWMEKATKDEALTRELLSLDDGEIESAFYRELEFGTGGLRGIIGAGTNRMNIYTVSKASRGIADYVNNYCQNPSVVIGYDSRINSELFAKTAAQVFASKGFRVHLWRELFPVSLVSFAIRYLHATAGVMITASHNPANYNGYKVYASDGCQITTEAAEKIQEKINETDVFENNCFEDFDEFVKSGSISYISDEVYEAFIEAVKGCSLTFGEDIDRSISIVYSPLNGTGLKPVLRVLSDSGFKNITVVKEQQMPDGKFPTCPYPNPEIKETLSLAIEYAEKKNADIAIATDPDCDRVGIAVKGEGGYEYLSGNEVGILLLDYICSQRIKHGKMPKNPVMIKTIVTSDLGARVAEKYGVRTIDVLTGFKFIGEKIGLLKKQGTEASYIFGFEESYGYLGGTYVRDKDGVGGTLLICEMLAFYKAQNISLLQRLNELYSEFGYSLNTLHSFTFEGAEGFVRMQSIMKKLRSEIKKLGSKEVESVIDYAEGVGDLPRSDVIKYVLSDNCSAVVRPSGTEPKLKIYICASANSLKAASDAEQGIICDLMEYLK